MNQWRHARIFALAIGWLIAVALTASGPAFAEKRVALVIGNGAYQHAPHLPNPPNDAKDVAAALKRSGFETILGVDLDQASMQDATISFARAARDADVALFYYAGHAMQFGGVNYLMPVDASLRDEADLRRMARVDQIVADLRQAKNLRILVLDSCRDNPLAEELKRSIGRTRAVGLPRGLAKIDSPQGMIVAFSTQTGRTAEDGSGRNSPYTAAFLRHIEEKAEIGRIFRRIAADVYNTTGHQQLPELSLSMIGEYYLRGQPSGSTPIETTTAADAAVAALQARLKTLEDQLKRQQAAPVPVTPPSTRNEPKVAVGVFPKPTPAGPGEAGARCDELAADPDDLAAKDAGIKWSVLYWGVRKHADAAIAVCEAAAAALPGVPRYRYQLGRALYQAIRFKDALAAIQAASDAGYAAATKELASWYDGPHAGLRYDAERARQLYRTAAKVGDDGAMESLGFMLWQGQGGPKDRALAVDWFSKAAQARLRRAEAGDTQAMRYLADMYEYGIGVPKDLDRALSWIRRAADLGDTDAMDTLASTYEYGWYDQPIDEATQKMWERRLFEALGRKAADGDAEAMNNLAWAYSLGEGVTEDETEALRWFMKAADAGYVDALSNIANAYENGYGTDESKLEADRWYRSYHEWTRRAADAGDAVALSDYGDAFRNGEGEPKNARQATEYYQRALDLGYGWAASGMASLYEDGDEFPGRHKDLAAAADWYQRCLERGVIYCANNLADVYEKGLGVRTDHARAAELYLLYLENQVRLDNYDLDDIREGSNALKQEVQKRLKAAGFYDDSIDGKFGPATEQALRDYAKRI